MSAISREDAESNARLLDALFGSVEEAEEQLKKDPEVSSHLQLDLDDDGQPTLLRFVYVDEVSCIGCTFCADVASNTFMMHEEAGRARAYAQGQDDPETIMEAIDTCPVNCISFVDLDDLVTLEQERDDYQMISQASIGVPATSSVRMNSLPPTKAKLSAGASLTCCNNCPGKGCKECPMYGVGMNPVYVARMEERQAKKEASGEAAQEREDDRRTDMVNAIFAEQAPAGLDIDPFEGMVDPFEGFVDPLDLYDGVVKPTTVQGSGAAPMADAAALMADAAAPGAEEAAANDAAAREAAARALQAERDAAERAAERERAERAAEQREAAARAAAEAEAARVAAQIAAREEAERVAAERRRALEQAARERELEDLAKSLRGLVARPSPTADTDHAWASKSKRQAVARELIALARDLDEGLQRAQASGGVDPQLVQEVQRRRTAIEQDRDSFVAENERKGISA